MDKEKAIELMTIFMQGCVPYIDKLIQTINEEKGDDTECGRYIDAMVGRNAAILSVVYANNRYQGFIDTKHPLKDVLDMLIQHYLDSKYND